MAVDGSRRDVRDPSSTFERRVYPSVALESGGSYPRFVDTGCDYAAVGSVAVELVS